MLCPNVQGRANCGSNPANLQLDSRQPVQKCCYFVPALARVKPATRGPSLSRGPRKPQTESVKKNMVIESFESSRESFARTGVRLLRGRDGEQARGAAARLVRYPTKAAKSGHSASDPISVIDTLSSDLP